MIILNSVLPPPDDDDSDLEQITDTALELFETIYDESSKAGLEEIEVVYAVWAGLISDLLHAGWTVEELQLEVAAYAECGDGAGRVH